MYSGKLNLPLKGGYLQTEDGYEHRGRNEDGPIDIKPKFKAWPNLLSSTSKTKSPAKSKPTKSSTVPSKGTTTPTTNKGSKP